MGSSENISQTKQVVVRNMCMPVCVSNNEKKIGQEFQWEQERYVARKGKEK